MDPAPTLHRATHVSAGRAFLRNRPAVVGLAVILLMVLACLCTLPWTLAQPAGEAGIPRYNAGEPRAGRLPPSWWGADAQQAARLNQLVDAESVERIAASLGLAPDELLAEPTDTAARELRRHWPSFALGTDALGRSLLLRTLTGGGISLTIGIAAALISVCIGTLYGGLSGYIGGRTDAVLMRIVDILYGLPYILLVVLLAVASDAVMDEYVTRQQARERWVQQEAALVAAERGLPTDRASVERLLSQDQDLRADLEARTEHVPSLQRRDISDGARTTYDVVVLLVAIGGVSWLTMARVIRGQVLSLKSQPFVEAARAAGAPVGRIFWRHLLPNLVGPIIVYATLTVPQAILQESFLSFLGIGVKPPLPSWGNLAAEGLSELNSYRSNWWLLLFPCLLLGVTLLALNFVGEGLREAFDPKRSRR
ncbi:MAG: ABC transporter permease [Phycisphaerales bacterium]|nr:ABC transporter permease [Phycisphaerales bacterium]